MVKVDIFSLIPVCLVQTLCIDGIQKISFNSGPYCTKTDLLLRKGTCNTHVHIVLLKNIKQIYNINKTSLLF